MNRLSQNANGTIGLSHLRPMALAVERPPMVFRETEGTATLSFHAHATDSERGTGS